MHHRVIAYHLILTTYGFWLPNDPRGSWSQFVRAWDLRPFGPATPTSERRSLARDPHNRQLRLRAKEHLAREPVEFTGAQARAVGRGFGRFIERSGAKIVACSILPSHVHLVIGRHAYGIEKLATFLKADATRQLQLENMHPFFTRYRDGRLPTPWARKSWSCFLDKEEDVERAITYTRENPAKEGKPPQRWSFVTPW